MARALCGASPRRRREKSQTQSVSRAPGRAVGAWPGAFRLGGVESRKSRVESPKGHRSCAIIRPCLKASTSRTLSSMRTLELMLRRLLSSSGRITRVSPASFRRCFSSGRRPSEMTSTGANHRSLTCRQNPSHTSTRPCSVWTRGNSKKSFVKAVRTFISGSRVSCAHGDPSGAWNKLSLMLSCGSEQTNSPTTPARWR